MPAARAVVSVLLMLAAAAAVAGTGDRSQPRGGPRMTGRMRTFCPSTKCRCYQENRKSPDVRMTCQSSAGDGDVLRFRPVNHTSTFSNLNLKFQFNNSKGLSQGIQLENSKFNSEIYNTSTTSTSTESVATYNVSATTENVKQSKTNFRVTVLSLQNANISRIQNRAFDQLPHLRVLDLGQNEALGERAINRRAFTGVKATLERLSLAGCALRAVPTASMTSLTNLRHLCLEYNNIHALHAHAFKGLRHLTVLHLYGNGLVTIETKAFQGLHALRQLMLYDNSLTHIRANTFSGLANVNSLDLANNHLVSLDHGAFRGLARLRKLNLDDNSIYTLSRDVLSDVRQLTQLSLRANPLTSLDDLALSPLHRLRHLVLPYVGDTPMTSLTFAGLRQLETLYLDEVRGASLTEGCLGPGTLPRLQRLSFSNYSGRFDALSINVMTSLDVGMAPLVALDVVVAPLGDCSCDHPWIGALVSRGSRVSGQCQGRGQRPVTCGRKTPQFTGDDFSAATPKPRSPAFSSAAEGKVKKRKIRP